MIEEVEHKIRVIEKGNIREIIDNHYNWYPGGQPTYSIGSTEKGIEYLYNLSNEDKGKLHRRLFNI